jgi:hypothetical protein
LGGQYAAALLSVALELLMRRILARPPHPLRMNIQRMRMSAARGPSFSMKFVL